MTFTGHADASSVVYTLVDSSKLANQIATLLPIVVKLLIDLNKTNTALGCRGKPNIDVMKKKIDLPKFLPFIWRNNSPIDYYEMYC